MEKRMLPLYIDIKAGQQYQMDRDTNEIYVLSMDFKKITKRSGNLGFVFAMIGIPIVGFLSEPLRPHLYMDISVNARIIMLAVTVTICVLFGLFFEQTIKTFVKLRKTEKTTTPNPKLKSFIEEKLEIELHEYEPVKLNKRERKRLLKKSFLEFLFLTVAVLIAILYFLPRFATEFIELANLLSLFWFSISSLVFVTPMFFLIMLFVHVVKIYMQERKHNCNKCCR